MAEERLKLAVFIDFDNIQIGVRDTLAKDFDVSLVLEALKERGEVVTKVAYGDWPRAGEQSRAAHHVQEGSSPPGMRTLSATGVKMTSSRPPRMMANSARAEPAPCGSSRARSLSSGGGILGCIQTSGSAPRRSAPAVS